MKLATLILTFLVSVSAFAADRITATVTVTNVPSNGATLTVNGVVRTFVNTITVPATQIITNSTVGGSATNLWLQISAYNFVGPINQAFSSTNVIGLVGAQGLAMTVTPSASWASVTYSTQSFSAMYGVRVPLANESVAVRTNIATLLVTGLQNYPQNAFAASTTALSNHVNTSTAQTFGNKTLTNSTYSGVLTNAAGNWIYVPYADGSAYSYTNRMGIYFHTSAGFGGGQVTAIAPDVFGNASLYDVSVTNYPWAISSFAPLPANLLNVLIASNKFGGKGWNNTWTQTNTFQQITNSAIVNSTLRYSGGISGTIEAITNGVYYTGTHSNGTYYGTIVRLNGLFTGDPADPYGMLHGTQITNCLIYNSSFRNTNNVVGMWTFNSGNVTSLAAGNNAGVDFGTRAFVPISAGPIGAFAICGIAGGQDGRLLYLYNRTGQAMTISNDSGVDPVAANRIYTNTGGDIVSTGNGAATLLYSTQDSRWIVINFQP